MDFVKATSCWHPASNLHTLISTYWLHYTHPAREDLWLNYTSRHISLSSILEKPYHCSASITVQLIIFSGISMVKTLQSNQLKHQCKLALSASSPASSFQTWHIKLFSGSSLVKNKYNRSLHTGVKLWNNYPSQWVPLSFWLVECSGKSY